MAGNPDEPVKRPSLTQERFDRMMKDWTKYLQPGHLMVLREFLERNPGVALEITDRMDLSRRGIVVSARDGAGIRVGNSIYTIFGHSNEDRFRLTAESAKKNVRISDAKGVWKP
jgi:hypothetical protein